MVSYAASSVCYAGITYLLDAWPLREEKNVWLFEKNFMFSSLLAASHFAYMIATMEFTCCAYLFATSNPDKGHYYIM